MKVTIAIMATAIMATAILIPTNAYSSTPANEDTWNNVVRFLIDLQITRVDRIPIIYINESLPIFVEKQYGTAREDAALAARSHIDNRTTGCKITINVDSSIWSEANLAVIRKTSSRNAIDTIKAKPDKRRNFLIMHEIGHCMDNDDGQLEGEDFYVWKELFADVFAVMNSRAVGVSPDAFRRLGKIRGADTTSQNSLIWQNAIDKALIISLPVDMEQMVLMTKAIRSDVWSYK